MSSDMPVLAEGAPYIETKAGRLYLHGSLLEFPYPHTLSLESTNICNLACTHCGHSQFPAFEKGHLNMGNFHKVRPLLGSKIKHLALSDFGEPFMSKAWPELLRLALEVEGLPVSFISNGLLLDRHIEEVMNPRISITISIDGVSEETYSCFRGKGNFPKLMRNLTLLKDEKKARGIKYPMVNFAFTVSRANCSELPELVETASALGVGNIIVQFQLFFDRKRFEAESLYFDRALYDKNIALAVARAHSLGINLLHPDSFDGATCVPREFISNSWLAEGPMGIPFCFAQLSSCYVKFNGQVEACCSPNRYVMGDLNSDSFEDIWHGPKYRALRAAFDRGEWPSECSSCPFIQTVDVTSESAHIVRLNRDDGRLHSFHQKYSVTELDVTYRSALDMARENPKDAHKLLIPLLETDANLYEPRNLAACLKGLSGDIDGMAAGIEELSRLFRRDPVIINNHNTISASRG